METKMKRLLIPLITGWLMLMTTSAFSQDAKAPLPSNASTYNNAIGLRFGTDLGITARTGWKNGYLEGILGTGYRAFVITGLFEKSIPAFNTSNFHWYYGAGAHVGMFDRFAYYNYYYDRYGNYHVDYVYGYVGPTFGIDGIFGLEYKFPDIPFAASLDLKPYLDLYRYGYGYMDGAISFRYVF